MLNNTDDPRAGHTTDWTKIAIIVMACLLSAAVLVLIATIYAANIVASRACEAGLHCDAGGFGSGPFGDAFGFVTSLFTGLAFAGLVITMIMQRAELHEVQEERKETQKQTKDLQETNERLVALQATATVEDRFFRLLDRASAEKTDLEAEASSPLNHTIVTACDLKLHVKLLNGAEHPDRDLAHWFCGYFDYAFPFENGSEQPFSPPREKQALRANINYSLLPEMSAIANLLARYELHEFAPLAHLGLLREYDCLLHLASIRSRLYEIKPRDDLTPFVIPDFAFKRMTKDDLALFEELEEKFKSIEAFDL